MNAHPLSGAYFNTLPHLFPIFINEWWYTCRSNSTNTAISGTIDHGKWEITIDQELIHVVLDSPAKGDFVAFPTKEEARASLSVIGFSKPKDTNLYSAFSPRWKFIISSIIRSLRGKSGNTGELNEFETQILSSFINRKTINYAELYFSELLKLVNDSARNFNVPFIQLFSLCFEHRIGESIYLSMANSVVDIPFHVLTTKVFNHNILPNETPYNCSHAVLD